MQISEHLNGEWRSHLHSEFEKPYFRDLQVFLSQRAKTGVEIYPAPENIFAALHATPPAKVKVVLLGQDPYHNPGQAHGLAFSVTPRQTPPPSLVNIYRELEADLGHTPPRDGCLTKWATQGVLLLNSVLTVEKSSPGAHSNKGWEQFTDLIIRKISEICSPTVFLLWGKPAQKKRRLIDHSRHCILQAPHPSPLSAYRGFHGCRHFSLANNYLLSQGRTAVDWRLEQN